MKIITAISIVLGIVIFVAAGVYLGTRFYLQKFVGPEYLFIHPSIAKIFIITPVCPTECGEGVCGEDGKNYCNKCIAFQNKAGFAYDGQCIKKYTNNIFGFSISFPTSWSDYQVIQDSWDGWLINTKTHYKGEKLIFKNQKLATENNFQGIPVMIITPDVWKQIDSGDVAVSAAPIGPQKIGENERYIFATPPRWYGFADNLDQGKINEILNIVKTFRAF